MTIKYRFLFFEAMMILSFAYAADGYTAASAAVSVFAAVYTLAVNGTDALRKDLFVLIPAGILEALLIRASAVSADLQILSCLSVISLFTADIWMAENAGHLHIAVTMMFRIFLVFVLLAAVLPDTAYGFGGTILIISMLFVPVFFFYAIVRVSYTSQKRRETLKA